MPTCPSTRHNIIHLRNDALTILVFSHIPHIQIECSGNTTWNNIVSPTENIVMDLNNVMVSSSQPA